MKLRLIIALLLLSVALTLVFLLIENFDLKIAALDVNESLSVQEEYWIEDINNRGPQKAYASFADLIAEVEPPRQHTLAHVMGGALYKVLGNEGLSYCTDEYSYGCYHEFLGQAIHEGGIPVIEQLSSNCESILKSQSLGCQHGIGHGILGYFGYDFNALLDALSNCELLGDETISRSCFGGVFMEYNTETLLSDQARNRAFDKELGYMYPCSSLTKSWQKSCYFWQIQWWFALDRQKYSDIEDRVKQSAGRCALVKDEYIKRECFRGIGYNLPGEANYDTEAVSSLCQHISSPVGQVECASGASGSLLANPASASVGYTVCDALSATDRNYCIRTATDPH